MNRSGVPEIAQIAATLATQAARAREDWLAAVLAKRMPPDLFLRAYGNQQCKADVAKWLEANGYQVREYPDRHEVWQFDERIAELKKPQISPKTIS